MFDKISDAAEKLASDVSRRAFLGRLGQGAIAVAMAIGGVLAFPANASATQKNCYCCWSGFHYSSRACVQQASTTFCTLIHTGCNNCHGPC
jgi:hypothetical protein